MSASRKLYVAVAERLKSVGKAADNADMDRYLWVRSVIVIADAFKADNSGFDKRRFAVAAGLTAGELDFYQSEL